MVTAVTSVLVLAGLLTIIGAVLFVLRSLWRSASSVGGRTVVRRPPPPFGALPTLDGPVGALGEPAPDADLSTGASSEHEIYGE